MRIHFIEKNIKIKLLKTGMLLYKTISHPTLNKWYTEDKNTTLKNLTETMKINKNIKLLILLKRDKALEKMDYSRCHILKLL